MASPPDVFLGLGSTEWTGVSAIASGIYDVLTFLLILFAAMQIYFSRKEAKITRTLAACERYDTDPIIDASCRKLATAWDNGDLLANPPAYRVDVYSVLNYLESIAIGVRRRLYSSDVVRAHMETIIIGYIEEYIDSGLVSKCASPMQVSKAVSEADYEHMVALAKTWSVRPWYKRLFSSR